MVRLRQVALAVTDLDGAVEELARAFGLAVAFRDPAVAAFGLVNAVMPVGDQFLEVVAPTREGTAAGRQMARMGGDGGYMVICQAARPDEQAAARGRAAALGVREAFTHVAEEGRSSICQFHPGDTGGSFLEVDCDTTAAGWSPAGPEWASFVRTDVVAGIAGVTVGSPQADQTASTWAAILGRPVTDRIITLDGGATITFADAAVHALTSVRLTGTDVPTLTMGAVTLTG